jgi:hypothetical protein
MVELESEAIKVGCKGASHWLKGCHFTILMDLKPLLSICNDQRLDQFSKKKKKVYSDSVPRD